MSEPFRVPVELVWHNALWDDEARRYAALCHDDRKPEPIAELLIVDRRFVAIVRFQEAEPVSLSLRIFPAESLAA